MNDKPANMFADTEIEFLIRNVEGKIAHLSDAIADLKAQTWDRYGREHQQAQALRKVGRSLSQNIQDVQRLNEMSSFLNTLYKDL